MQMTFGIESHPWYNSNLICIHTTSKRFLCCKPIQGSSQASLHCQVVIIVSVDLVEIGQHCGNVFS